MVKRKNNKKPGKRHPYKNLNRDMFKGEKKVGVTQAYRDYDGMTRVETI